MPKGHKESCRCFVCKHKRGEKVVHKVDCQCMACKLEREEKIIHKSDCGCMCCRMKRKEFVGRKNHMFGKASKDTPMYRKNAWEFMDKEAKKRRRNEVSKFFLKLWQDLEYRKKMTKIQRRAAIKRWQDPGYWKMQMKAQGVKPNKAEQKLGDFLQQILPSEYKYVGDGEFIIAGKCPDFININGQKKIIELFGNYWHKGDTGQERIALFKQYGYETLIVWEHELKNIEDLKNKILDFQTGG